uniref:Zinc-hook domain-containing protein n=1 Tax=Haemonchus contortus TaxID=6289 RepID=A0A7I4YU03_HAECO
ICRTIFSVREIQSKTCLRSWFFLGFAENMVLLNQLMVRGIRSVGSSEEETQVIRFLNPLTIISGPNGSGKTTLIEALNYITTGSLPSGKLASFVHSVEACLKPRVDGLVKLQFTDCKGRLCVATKRVNATLSKQGKLQCKSDEFNIQITLKDGQVHSLSSKVADFQKEIVNLLGVPAAILDNVIFCHQEDSNWPLSEPKELKLRFDRIFRLTRFVKAIEIMKKMKKDYESQLATLIEKQSCKEMVVKSKTKYVHQRDSCNSLRKQSKESIRSLDTKIKLCTEIIEASNQKILEIEELERNAEIKQAELRMLNEQLSAIKVAPYPGTERELRAEIQEIDSSAEFQELESRRDRMQSNIDSISRDIVRMKKEKEEAENEMRNAASMKMMENDILNDLHDLERHLVVSFGVNGPDYAGELREKISFEENELQTSREASNIARRKNNGQVDAAQMELTKLTCEASNLLSSVEQRKSDIATEERKLLDANVNQQQLEEISKQIDKLEMELSKIPHIEEQHVEDLQSRRQQLQKEVEGLREQCRMAEKFAETEGAVERKNAQRAEVQQELNALIEKHSDSLTLEFGKVPDGPWSDTVDAKLKSEEESTMSMEKEIRMKERDLDRTTQALQQAINTEKQLVGEVEQLREKISELCSCAPKDVEDNLCETRIALSKARKELASLRTKAMLYESWSEEVTKRSCCPLCERRFTSKTGAIELSGKLLDMSLAVPDDIERLERLVQVTEERERHLGNALIHVEQCKKIMDGKVKLVRKEVGDRNREETFLIKELELLSKEHINLNSSFKRLLDVKADVSLMDSLLTSIQSLNDQINELSEGLKEASCHGSLPALKKEVAEKEECISSLNSQIENLHLGLSKRNALTSKLHELRERRISSCEAAARVEHIREMVARHRAEIAELNHRRDEIMERHLPRAEMGLQKAKEERDNAESCAKNQEDLKLALIRELRNQYNLLNSTIDKLNKVSSTTRQETLDELSRHVTQCCSSITELEKRKTMLEISINDLEGSQSKRRTLEDQLTRLLIASRISNLERELADLVYQGEGKDVIYQERDKAVKERDESNLEKARLKGQLEEVEKKISDAMVALSSKEMKQAESLYHEVVVSKIITQEMISDLEKYMQCLDSSIIQFHSDKMVAINRILDELWRKVYGGTDIQSISIKSECAASTEKRKVYDYRVAMVIKNGVELDMRDRCSAGQKVLACILIRIALADVFGGACSIIALDEPTTNLDALKVDHIAGMLNLIAVRRRGERNKQFQMIVITHDDHLVGKLMIGSKPDFIYVLGKDSHGVSHIRRQYSDGRFEYANLTTIEQ